MNASILDIFLAFSAIIVSLSIIIQTLQEIYKYLTNSKSKAFSKAMYDYMGTLFDKIIQAPNIQDTKGRGPFQIFNFRPKDYIAPITKSQFEEALHSTLPTWKKILREKLIAESKLQNGTSALESVEWKLFVDQLTQAEAYSSNKSYFKEVIDFMKEWNLIVDNPNKILEILDKNYILNSDTFDANQILKAFEIRFLEDHKYYLENYSHFYEKFTEQYKRRNFRQSFVIALLFCLVLNLPIQEVVKAAKSLKYEDALKILNSANLLQSNLNNFKNEAKSEQTANATTENTSNRDTLDNKNENKLNTPKANIDSLKSLKDSLAIALLKDSKELIDLIKSKTKDSSQLFDFQAAWSNISFNKHHCNSCAKDTLIYCCKCKTIIDSINPSKCKHESNQIKYYANSEEIKSNCKHNQNKTNNPFLYILGCMATAVSICFGAPIINDLATRLISIKK